MEAYAINQTNSIRCDGTKYINVKINAYWDYEELKEKVFRCLREYEKERIEWNLQRGDDAEMEKLSKENNPDWENIWRWLMEEENMCYSVHTIDFTDMVDEFYKPEEEEEEEEEDIDRKRYMQWLLESGENPERLEEMLREDEE